MRHRTEANTEREERFLWGVWKREKEGDNRGSEQEWWERERGEGEPDTGNPLEDNDGKSLVYCCLRWWKCSFVLSSGSFSEANFHSEFHLEACVHQSKIVVCWDWEILLHFFSQESEMSRNEHYCSNQMFPRVATASLKPKSSVLKLYHL